MAITMIFRIARFYSSEFLVYPLETVALILRRVFAVGLLLLFWHLVAAENDILGLNIVPYILIATGTQFLSVGHNFTHAGEIAEDIKHGRLNSLLIRPVNELHYEFGAYLGRSVFEFGFSAANIVVGLCFLGHLEPARLGLFAVSLVPAMYLGYALNIAVAAAAFWVIDITYFRLLFYFMIRIMSGLYVPLTFFGGALGQTLQYLPFAHLAFVPSYTLTGDDLGKAAMLVAVGFAEAVIALKAAHLLWRKGLKHYGAVGI